MDGSPASPQPAVPVNLKIVDLGYGNQKCKTEKAKDFLAGNPLVAWSNQLMRLSN